MRARGCGALWLASALTVCAFGQEKGIETDWDMRPVLDQIDVPGMVKNGAPETYASQINESKVQAKALSTEALVLANSPEKLSADLTTLFRLLSLEKTLLSVEEGLRKYWNPALADLLNGQMMQNSPNRERFQRYILDLAAAHEQEYAVMDHEAQRCRGALAKQPPNKEKK